MWFYRTFPILLFSMSFILKDGNLFVRYPWGVPLCSYRSFTPTCTVSIPLCLKLSTFRGTHIVVTSDLISKILHIPWVAHPEYPVVCVWGLCLKMSFYLTSVRHPPYRVSIKTPHARALQKVRDSLIWWWHLFLLHCLTITPSQSLMLDFCYPS